MQIDSESEVTDTDENNNLLGQNTIRIIDVSLFDDDEIPTDETIPTKRKKESKQRVEDLDRFAEIIKLTDEHVLTGLRRMYDKTVEVLNEIAESLSFENILD